MSPFRGVSLCVVLLASTLSAQPLSESIEVRVLEIEAVVVDRSGKVVEGLNADDFDVRIDGRRRELSNFYAVRRSAIVDEVRAAAKPDGVRPATTISTSLVIFIDDMRLRHASKRRALDALERYVRANVGAMTTATLMRYDSNLKVRIRPTERPGHLLTEIERMRREPVMVSTRESERARIVGKILKMTAPIGASTDEASEDGARGRGSKVDGVPADVKHDHELTWREVEAYARRETHDVERTLEALHDAVRLAAGFDGRKVLLYVSEGLPQTPGLELFDFFTRMAAKSPSFSVVATNSYYTMGEALRYDRTSQFQRLAAAAQRANVAFYSFDAAGVRAFEVPGLEVMTSTERLDSMMLRGNEQNGVRLVAEETGGRFLNNDNDLDRVLATMSEQFATYYSLGIRAPSQSRGMKVQVSVKNRPELRVISSRRRTQITPEQQIAQSLRSRLYTRLTENPLSARVTVTPPSKLDGRCLAVVRVEVPPNTIGTLAEIHFAVLNDRNDESDIHTENVASDNGALTHSFTLRVQPRAHILSLAIADRASGATSYLQQDVDGSQCR